MKNSNIFLDLLENVKPSLFLTVVMFIVGIVVPGACGLAIYNIDLFKEIDLIKLILISIGISSPSLIISFYLNLGIYKSFEDKNSIESIFLFAGFISIIILIITVFLNHSDYDIKNVYILVVTISLVISIIFAQIRVYKDKKKQNNKNKTKNKSSAK